MDFHNIENDPYKLKLSILRIQVSQELISVSSMLSETMRLLKCYINNPEPNQDKIINQSILKAGMQLNTVDLKIHILNKRIEQISRNFKENINKEEGDVVKMLIEEVPKNTKSMSILKKYYLELINLQVNSESDLKSYTDFDCFKASNDIHSNQEPIKNSIKNKTKKHKWSCL